MGPATRLRCLLLFVVLLLVPGGCALIALSPDATAPGTPTAASPTGCASLTTAPSRQRSLWPMDGSLPWVDGWELAWAPDPGDAQTIATAPGREMSIAVYGFPAQEIVIPVVRMLGLDELGDATVLLSDGASHPATIVGQDLFGNVDRGILVTYSVGADRFALLATTRSECFDGRDATLRGLLARIDPPHRWLVPVPTPLVIDLF